MNNNDSNDDTFPEMVAAPVEQNIQYEEAVPEPVHHEEAPEPVYEEEEVIVEPVKKEVLKKNQMFISTPSSEKIKKTEEAEPPKKEKKKRVMTDEAKAKLAVARAKGLETRKRNTELRKQAKIQQQEEKELVKNVRKRRVQKLKKELEDDDEPVSPKEQVKQVEPKVIEKVVEKGYSQDQMNEAINKALQIQEAQRKVRKAEKKVRVEAEQKQEKVLNTISRAIQPTDVWADCFR